MSITSLRGSTLPNRSFSAGKAKTKDVVRIAPDTATTFATGASITGGSGGGPTISNVSVTDSSYILSNTTPYIDSAGGYIKITGTGFAAGCTAYVGGSPATATTFVSATEVRAQVGAASSNAQSVYVVNTDNSVGILLNAITYSGTPSWSTGATLTSQVSDIAFSISLSATSDSSIVYSLVSGSSTPSGTTLYSNGTFAGTVTGISVDTNYSFTVLATDLENQLSTRAFTVSVATGDQYFYITPLLLNGEATTWITDASTNKFLPTISGDTRPLAFSPYNTNWSAYFDGTNDYLAYTYNTTFGSGNFTVECWVYMPVITNTYSSAIIGTTYYDGLTKGWSLEINSSGYPIFTLYNTSGTGVTTTSSTLLPATQWTHLAAVRSGTTVTIYMNGVSVASGTNATTDNFSNSIYFATNSTSFAIGQSTYSYTGYISNARIVVGTAVYTGTFTPQTSSLTATQSSGTNIAAISSGTSLLTLQNNRFVDNSTNAFAVTRTGDVAIRSFGPFVETDITTGSGYFDGTGDYLSIGTAANWVSLHNTAAQWTMDFWVYPITYNGSLLETCDSSTQIGIFLGLAAGGLVVLQIMRGVTSSFVMNVTGSVSAPLNAWSHIQISYDYSLASNNVAIYVNGTVNTASAGSFTKTANAPSSSNPTSPLYVGYSSASQFQGYITDLRIRTGIAVNSAPTLPTTSVSSNANTQLLTLQYRRGDNNHRFVDESGVRALTTRGGNASQGSFSPFSPAGWSGYFNGSSHLQVAANSDFNITGDFTLECWYYATSQPAPDVGSVRGSAFAGYSDGSTANAGWHWLIDWTNNKLIVSSWGTANGIECNYTPTIGVWTHFAAARSGATSYLFINGASQTLTKNTLTINAGVSPVFNIGRSSNNSNYYYYVLGYISNFRIIKGTAQYTANFTPATSSLSVVSTNTSILTLQNNRFVDANTTPKTITLGSSPRIQAFSPFRPSGSYNPVTHGGSAYFDGSGDYVYITNNAVMTLGTKNHCIEFWMYPDGTQAQYACPWYYNGSIVYYFSIGSEAGGDVTLLVGGGSPWSLAISIGNTEYLKLLNNWSHVAITRSGTAFRMFFNGVLRAYGTTSQSISAQTSAFSIGWDLANATTYYKGWMSNFRVINGSIPAAYQTSSTTTGTTIFTPPTSVPAFEANTAMAMDFTNGGIVDASARNVMETAGTAKISNVASKFGIGSINFGTRTDYLAIPSTPTIAILGGDFTLEAWIYPTDISVSQTWGIIDARQSAGSANAWIWRLDSYSSGWLLNFYTGTNYSSTGRVQANVWTHVAVVRSGTTLTFYINGSASGTATVSGVITGTATTNPIFIGTKDTGSGATYGTVGYIDDLRITNGFARTITLPTTAFLTK